MMLEHLSDVQVYEFGLSIIAVALALLIGVVAWPMDDRRADRGGFQ